MTKYVSNYRNYDWLVHEASLLPELKSMPKADFVSWLTDNYELYEYFSKYAEEAINRGRKRFSAYMIRERVRWYTNVEYDGDYKISNNLTPYIARLLIVEYPVLAEIFSCKNTPEEGNLELFAI